MPNLAALRAAIFLLSAKNRWGGGHICAPPGRARVKRTQAIRVRSSCFGCLATPQKRQLESKGSCLFASTSGGSWARCGFFCFLERPKRVFSHIFFRVFGCRKRCDLPQGAAIEFLFFPIKKQREFWWVCQAPIVFATIVAPTLSPICVYRMYRPWERSAVFDKKTQWSECWNQARNPSADSRGLQTGGWDSGTPGSAFMATRRASLFLGTEGALMECDGPGDVCSARAGPLDSGWSPFQWLRQ